MFLKVLGLPRRIASGAQRWPAAVLASLALHLLLHALLQNAKKPEMFEVAVELRVNGSGWGGAANSGDTGSAGAGSTGVRKASSHKNNRYPHKTIRPVDRRRDHAQPRQPALTAAQRFPTKPLFVPESATPAEVDMLWKKSVVRQHLLLGAEVLAEAEGPGATPADASGTAGGSGQAAGGSGQTVAARISGRLKAGSTVVRSPTLESGTQGQCPSSLTQPLSVIRFLVGTDGRISHAYVKQTSKDNVFDRCATELVLRLRFRPGVDERNEALNVWMHAHVGPSVCPERSSNCTNSLRFE
jgi:hypothetical protein